MIAFYSSRGIITSTIARIHAPHSLDKLITLYDREKSSEFATSDDSHPK